VNTAIDTAPDASEAKSPIKRFAPLGIIALGLALFFYFDGPSYVNMDSLRENREVLAGFVQENFLLAFLGFIAAYAVLVAISFPGSSILTIVGGFLFGAFTGTLGVVIAATLGATAIFFAAKTAFGESLRAKLGSGKLAKFEEGLKDNELSYLFILRLVPIFPFFLVNVAPALFDVKTRNYMISTFFGIIPGSFVYASVGNGIGAVFDRGEEANLSGLMFQPAVIGPILGLIALAMIPVIYKRVKASKT
jgi:uncharacterized membrane protein YdjX (TVP38/TMEM64 family)